MSYSRWGGSHWYTYWHAQDKETENRDTAIFEICTVASFTAKELRDDVEQCILAAMKKDIVGEMRNGLDDELRGYMEQFLADVDEAYPDSD